MILAAVYLLWSYQRVFFGTLTHESNRGLKDMTPREWAVLVPIVIMVVWIGLYPSTFLDKSAASARRLIEQVEAGRRGDRVVTTAGIPSRIDAR